MLVVVSFSQKGGVQFLHSSNPDYTTKYRKILAVAPGFKVGTGVVGFHLRRNDSKFFLVNYTLKFVRFWYTSCKGFQKKG